jgi:hypothetical protein
VPGTTTKEEKQMKYESLKYVWSGRLVNRPFFGAEFMQHCSRVL